MKDMICPHCLKQTMIEIKKETVNGDKRFYRCTSCNYQVDTKVGGK